MKKILLIESSPRGSDSYSHQAARSIVNELQRRNPGTKVVVRDLGQRPPPHVGQAFITGMYAAPEQRTPEQAKTIALSDALIDELFAADTIVMAVPMHNFAPPSTLKPWIDHIARAGRTFSYSSNGPEGLLKGKRAIVVLASGGMYSNGPAKPFDSPNRICARCSASSASRTWKWCASKVWRTVQSVRKRRWLRPARNQSTSWPNSRKQQHHTGNH
jgi:FMN-dependent NADH-azoreductase